MKDAVSDVYGLKNKMEDLNNKLNELADQANETARKVFKLRELIITKQAEEPENKDVHTEHCCRWHGCKYGECDCTVASGEKKQSFLCEECYAEIEEQ